VARASEVQTEDRRLQLTLPARPEILGPIREALARMGMPEPLLGDAVLLTSELVTNSLRHAGLEPADDIELTAEWSGSTLRVVVRDGGRRDLPANVVAGTIRPSPTGRSGWGLYLVDRLASRWGTNLGGRPGFWFELEDPRDGED
jgi:anti-sigma regulatory factor (Ser/Thr protein kinase)